MGNISKNDNFGKDMFFPSSLYWPIKPTREIVFSSGDVTCCGSRQKYENS